MHTRSTFKNYGCQKRKEACDLSSVINENDRNKLWSGSKTSNSFKNSMKLSRNEWQNVPFHWVNIIHMIGNGKNGIGYQAKGSVASIIDFVIMSITLANSIKLPVPLHMRERARATCVLVNEAHQDWLNFRNQRAPPKQKQCSGTEQQWYKKHNMNKE